MDHGWTDGILWPTASPSAPAPRRPRLRCSGHCAGGHHIDAWEAQLRRGVRSGQPEGQPTVATRRISVAHASGSSTRHAWPRPASTTSCEVGIAAWSASAFAERGPDVRVAVQDERRHIDGGQHRAEVALRPDVARRPHRGRAKRSRIIVADATVAVGGDEVREARVGRSTVAELAHADEHLEPPCHLGRRQRARPPAYPPMSTRLPGRGGAGRARATIVPKEWPTTCGRSRPSRAIKRPMHRRTGLLASRRRCPMTARTQRHTHATTV